MSVCLCLHVCVMYAHDCFSVLVYQSSCLDFCACMVVVYVYIDACVYIYIHINPRSFVCHRACACLCVLWVITYCVCVCSPVAAPLRRVCVCSPLSCVCVCVLSSILLCPLYLRFGRREGDRRVQLGLLHTPALYQPITE